MKNIFTFTILSLFSSSPLLHAGFNIADILDSEEDNKVKTVMLESRLDTLSAKVTRKKDDKLIKSLERRIDALLQATVGLAELERGNSDEVRQWFNNAKTEYQEGQRQARERKAQLTNKHRENISDLSFSSSVPFSPSVPSNNSKNKGKEKVESEVDSSSTSSHQKLSDTEDKEKDKVSGTQTQNVISLDALKIDLCKKIGGDYEAALNLFRIVAQEYSDRPEFENRIEAALQVYGIYDWHKLDQTSKEKFVEEVYPMPSRSQDLTEEEVASLRKYVEGSGYVGIGEDNGLMEFNCMDRPKVQFLVTSGNKATAAGLTSQMAVKMENLFERTVTWDDPDKNPIIRPGFEYLWHLGASLPIRRIPNGVEEIFNPWTEKEARSYIAPFDPFYGGNLRSLTQKGDEEIYRYAQNKNFVYAVMNCALNTYLTHAHPALVPRIRNLRNAIIHQEPKYEGLVFRAALHSSSEILSMAFKKKFFIPNFFSTAIERDKCSYTKGKHNVMFAIDTRDFPDHSTIIKNYQSPYDESECLFACYDLFEYGGCEYVEIDDTKDALMVYLKVINPATYKEPESFPETFYAAYKESTRKQGPGITQRNKTPQELRELLKYTGESLIRNLDKKIKRGADNNGYFGSKDLFRNKSLEPYKVCKHID